MPTKRFYEWRYADTGQLWGKPLECEDACEFWLKSYAAPATSGKQVVSGGTGRSLHLYVSKTGERVDISGEPGVRARLHNEPLTDWVKFKK